MPSTSAPFGFRPIYHPSGQIRANSYNPGAKALATAIFRGDPVKAVMDGTDFLTVASGAEAILGIFGGCEYIDNLGKPTESNYWPGSVSGATNITFYVYDDPNIVYAAQMATSATTQIGHVANATIAAGNTMTGLSGAMLSGIVSATTRQWRIVGAGKGVDNALTDAYPIVEVQVAMQQYIASVAQL